MRLGLVEGFESSNDYSLGSGLGLVECFESSNNYSLGSGARNTSKAKTALKKVCQGLRNAFGALETKLKHVQHYFRVQGQH